MIPNGWTGAWKSPGQAAVNYRQPVSLLHKAFCARVANGVRLNAYPLSVRKQEPLSRFRRIPVQTNGVGHTRTPSALEAALASG